MIIYTYIHIHIDLNHFRKGDITHRKEGHTEVPICSRNSRTTYSDGGYYKYGV